MYQISTTTNGSEFIPHRGTFRAITVSAAHTFNVIIIMNAKKKKSINNKKTC